MTNFSTTPAPRQEALHEFEARKADLRRAQALVRKGKGEAAAKTLEALCIEARTELHVLLSWGGPSDGFRIYIDEDGTPVAGCYYFANWSEHEEFDLTTEEVEAVVEAFRIDPSAYRRA